MRHRFAALSAGVLLAASLGARAENAPKRPVPISGPLPIGVEADVYCSGYLGDEQEGFPGRIVNAEQERSQSMFMMGDIVYLDLGTDNGVQAGMEFTIVRPTRLVNQWGSIRDVLGRIYMTPGRVRVLCAQERSSIAEIVYSCNEVEIGDLVAPFEPIPVPLVRRTTPATICDTPNGQPIGHVVDTRDAVTPIGTGTVVFLDLGEDNGLNPGDFLTVFHPSGKAEGVRTVLGEAAILATRKHASVAIITSMKDNIAVGDWVELK